MPGVTRRRGGRSGPSGKSSGGGAGKTVLAFLLGAGAAAGAGYLYVHSTPPAAITRPSRDASAPVASRAEPVQPVPSAGKPVAPFGISEDVFEAGARGYVAHCASCHGTPGGESVGHAKAAPQLWRRARAETAARDAGDLYTGIAVGAPAKGMPAYSGSLTEREIWQIALLLKNADGDMPDPVIGILNGSHKR